MQKIKIKTTHIKNPRMELEYYFLLKGGMCGIEIRDTCDGASAARFVPDAPEAVYKFLLKLAQNALCPVHLGDVVDDYIYENWQLKRRLYPLQTDPCAGLDRGKRDAETVGNLLAGIATDEG